LLIAGLPVRNVPRRPARASADALTTRSPWSKRSETSIGLRREALAIRAHLSLFVQGPIASPWLGRGQGSGTGEHRHADHADTKDSKRKQEKGEIAGQRRSALAA